METTREKMSIERFRNIEAKFKEIYNILLEYEKQSKELPKDEEIKFDDILSKSIEEINNSDLSDIPFEEYKNANTILFFGNEALEFNNTNANIDFNIIDFSKFSKISVKGCNLRNLDFSKIKTSQVDDESFDKEIMKQYPSYFLKEDITDLEVRKRFYQYNLNLGDLITWNLYDIENDRFDYLIRENLQNIDKKKIIYTYNNFEKLFESIYDNNIIKFAEIIDSSKNFEENRNKIIEYLKQQNNNFLLLKLLTPKEVLDLEVLNYSNEQIELISSVLENSDFANLKINVNNLIYNNKESTINFFKIIQRYGVDNIITFEEKYNIDFFTRDNGVIYSSLSTEFEELKKETIDLKEEFKLYAFSQIVKSNSDKCVDKEIREKYPTYFLRENVNDEDVRKRFYRYNLNLGDLITWNLHDIENERFDYSIRDKIKNIDKKNIIYAYNNFEKLFISIYDQNIINFAKIIDNSKDLEENKIKIIDYLNQQNNNFLLSKLFTPKEVLVLNLKKLNYSNEQIELISSVLENSDFANLKINVNNLIYNNKESTINFFKIIQRYGVDNIIKFEEKYNINFYTNTNKEITLKELNLFSKLSANFDKFENKEKNINEEFLLYSFSHISKLSTVDEILKMNTILDEQLIKKIISIYPENINILLFSENIDKNKIAFLSKAKEFNINNLNMAISNVYLENSKDNNYDLINNNLDRIYNLVCYNNVPEFIKTFKLFQYGTFHHVNNDCITTYQNISENERDKIILADLFKISLESNNKSLRNFAKIMKVGQEIISKINNNDLSNLSKEEFSILNQYTDSLINIHNIAIDIQQNNKNYIENNNDIIVNLQNLSKEYGLNNLEITSDIIFKELFGNEIKGQITPNNILSYMDKYYENSMLRNRQNSEDLSNGNLHLEIGDAIKGIKNFDKYIQNMLSCGLKGGEFNREHSHSDATPLDWDLSFIVEEYLSNSNQSDFNIINKTYSGNFFGRTWIILKKYDDRIEKNSDLPIKFSRNTEAWTSNGTDRYERTGTGILNIDYIITQEWKYQYGYEMAMSGIFIPVKDTADNLIFSKEDYDNIRAQMKGLSYYNAEPFEVDQKTKNIEYLFEIYKNLEGSKDNIESVKKILNNENDEITENKKKSTLEFLTSFFEQKGIIVTPNLSFDLSTNQIELIDTGSTGRGTNVPGDGDFDFMLRHNFNESILDEFQKYVFELNHKESKTLLNGFRIKNVTLPDEKNVDIDVTYENKDVEFSYSSDMCIKDRLNSIKQKNPEEYNYVIANIIMAKNILKKLGIYKKQYSDGATKYGGFGGIGVENWILQNGGSFSQAIDTYLESTKNEKGEDLSYTDFIEKYPIFDFGFNHRTNNSFHDRFSSFLTDKGFYFTKEKFKEIQTQLKNMEQEKNTTPSKLRESISLNSLKEKLDKSRNATEIFCEKNFSLLIRSYGKIQKQRCFISRNSSRKVKNG